MDLVPILSTVILIMTLITLIIALASYMTFRIKEKKKQAAMAQLSETFTDDLTETPDADIGDAVDGADVSPVVSVEVNAMPAPMVQAGMAGVPSVAAIVPMMAQAPQMQMGLPMQQTPQMMPGQMPGYPQQQMTPQGMPLGDPYGMQFQPLQPPPPPAPNLSSAQAAFMQGFDRSQQMPVPSGNGVPAPAAGDYNPQMGLRRFAPPEQKPRQEPPPAFGHDSPTWK